MVGADVIAVGIGDTNFRDLDGWVSADIPADTHSNDSRTAATETRGRS
jgi:hypothetical protein